MVLSARMPTCTPTSCFVEKCGESRLSLVYLEVIIVIIRRVVVVIIIIIIKRIVIVTEFARL